MDAGRTDEPVGYMERTRLYYRALGYAKDYVWSTYQDVPFARLQRPLADSQIALITTASPPGLTNRDDKRRKLVWSDAVASPPERPVTDNVAWDKESTHTDDRESYLPIGSASQLASDGLFAGLTEHFVGVPTEYSQGKTIDIDASEVLARLQADGAEGAILCPL